MSEDVEKVTLKTTAEHEQKEKLLAQTGEPPSVPEVVPEKPAVSFQKFTVVQKIFGFYCLSHEV